MVEKFIQVWERNYFSKIKKSKNFLEKLWRKKEIVDTPQVGRCLYVLIFNKLRDCIRCAYFGVYVTFMEIIGNTIGWFVMIAKLFLSITCHTAPQLSHRVKDLFLTKHKKPRYSFCLFFIIKILFSVKTFRKFWRNGFLIVSPESFHLLFRHYWLSIITKRHNQKKWVISKRKWWIGSILKIEYQIYHHCIIFQGYDINS